MFPITHEPVYIKGLKHTAVVIGEEDYNALQETLDLQSIPGMVKSITDASKELLSEAIDHSKVEW